MNKTEGIKRLLRVKYISFILNVEVNDGGQSEKYKYGNCQKYLKDHSYNNLNCYALRAFES